MDKRFCGILSSFSFVFLVFLLAGCQSSGVKYYNTAMEFSQAGNYVNAITHLEEAIKLEPNNSEYRAALSRIKESQIASYLSTAKNHLDTTPITKDALDRAKTAMSKAEEIFPDSPNLRKIQTRYWDIETTFNKEIEDEYKTVKEQIALKKWDSAYFTLQKMQDRYPTYEDTEQLMQSVVAKGGRDYYNLAVENLEQDNISESILYANKALSLNENNSNVQNILNMAKAKDNLDYFVTKGGKAVTFEDWETAIRYYKKALTYQPDNVNLRQKLNEVYANASSADLEMAIVYLEQGYLLKAFERYENVLKLSSYLDSDLLSKFTDLFCEQAGDLAEMMHSEKNFGSAWYWYKKIQKVNNDYPEIFYSIQKMEDEINARIKKAIAVFDFSSPSDAKDAGIIIANNLITYLFNSAGKDIRILERENLKSILEEMKLSQIGVVDPNSAQEMGYVYGIDVAIMGSVLLYKVESSQTKGKKTIRYKTGTKISDNIRFLNWKAKNPSPTKEELKNAPSAKIVEDVFTEKDYEVSQHKKNGFIQLSFRIVDVTTGENIKVNTIEVKKEVSDDGSAGLPEAGITYDPLEIITDVALLQDLADTAVAELGKEALKPLQALEKTYYEAGESYLKRRNPIAAAESFINAIFDEKIKLISNSEITDNSSSKIHDIFYDYQIPTSTIGMVE